MGHGGVDIGNQSLQNVVEELVREENSGKLSDSIENIRALYGKNQADTYESTVNEVLSYND